MARGGARNRSGPSADPLSERSDRRGVRLTALPSEGYRGKVPDFPLPDAADREIEVWAREWASPVACWWATRPDLHADVALYVRFLVLIEGGEAKGTDINGYLRLKDQIGRSPAGMKENGLAVAVDEVGAKAAERPTLEPGAARPARRLRSADAQ